MSLWNASNIKRSTCPQEAIWSIVLSALIACMGIGCSPVSTEVVENTSEVPTNTDTPVPTEEPTKPPTETPAPIEVYDGEPVSADEILTAFDDVLGTGRDGQVETVANNSILQESLNNSGLAPVVNSEGNISQTIEYYGSRICSLNLPDVLNNPEAESEDDTLSITDSYQVVVVYGGRYRVPTFIHLNGLPDSVTCVTAVVTDEQREEGLGALLAVLIDKNTGRIIEDMPIVFTAEDGVIFVDFRTSEIYVNEERVWFEGEGIDNLFAEIRANEEKECQAVESEFDEATKMCVVRDESGEVTHFVNPDTGEMLRILTSEGINMFDDVREYYRFWEEEFGSTLSNHGLEEEMFSNLTNIPLNISTSLSRGEMMSLYRFNTVEVNDKFNPDTMIDKWPFITFLENRTDGPVISQLVINGSAIRTLYSPSNPSEFAQIYEENLEKIENPTPGSPRLENLSIASLEEKGVVFESAEVDFANGINIELISPEEAASRDDMFVEYPLGSRYKEGVQYYYNYYYEDGRICADIAVENLNDWIAQVASSIPALGYEGARDRVHALMLFWPYYCAVVSNQGIENIVPPGTITQLRPGMTGYVDDYNGDMSRHYHDFRGWFMFTLSPGGGRQAFLVFSE